VAQPGSGGGSPNGAAAAAAAAGPAHARLSLSLFSTGLTAAQEKKKRAFTSDRDSQLTVFLSPIKAGAEGDGKRVFLLRSYLHFFHFSFFFFSSAAGKFVHPAVH
jgi:hypothetical protein